MAAATRGRVTESSPCAGLNRARVAIALGSNLGDRHRHLAWAAERLADGLDDVVVSSFIETEPVETREPQPPYLNAAATARCALAPGDLLAWLLELERQRGRTRAGWHAARTLDLDLILYGDLVISRDDLALPHPRFRERRFVLEPLAEIAPDMRDPVTGASIANLLQRL